MRLPGNHHARIDKEKITGYLLSGTHQKGRSKALFFQRHGFRMNAWNDFAEALLLQARRHDVSGKIETPYGPRYYVDGILQTPDGANPQIRTVWQFDETSEFPRLITAYPIGR